jgi:phospholipid/cholesterol/gamma-HCH transport system substrate-binding protein
MRRQYGIEVWVGVFVVLAGLALAFMALSVSGLSLSGWGAKYYTVTEVFPSVQNLKVRAPVRIAGVQVGQVTAIGLNPNTLQAEVTLRVEDQYDRIPVDSVGQINASSLLGDNYVQITPGIAGVYLRQGSVVKTSDLGQGGLMGLLSSVLGGGSGLDAANFGQSSMILKESFPTVGGLSIGTAVKISGVKVGQVTAIALDPSSYTAMVSFSVLKSYAANLPIDSVGQISSESLLGGYYLNLLPGAMPMTVTPGMELPKQGIPPVDLATLLSTFMSHSSDNASSSSTSTTTMPENPGSTQGSASASMHR